MKVKASSKSRRIVMIVLSAIIIAWLISFFSPGLAIRKYIFLKLQPINSITADITDMNYYDSSYGHLYNVTNFEDTMTGDELGAVYVKKFGPFWRVASAGTGP